MKKVLTMLLAALMILSCMTEISLAEEEATEGPAPIYITDGTTIEGWSHTDPANSGMVDPAIDAELGVVAATYTGILYANGGWKNPAGDGVKPTNGLKIGYQANKDPNNAERFDVTEMTHIAFDMYISNAAALAGKEFDFELTSGGKADVQEIYWRMPLEAIKGGKLVDGWNRMEIPLDSFKQGMGTDGVPMDATRWTSLRLYTTDTFELGGNMLTVAYKNFGFAENGSGVSGGEDNAQVAAAAEEIFALFEAISNISVGKVIASNYETVKAQLDAAIKA